MDYAPAYTITKPTDVMSTNKNRWFNPSLATMDITNATARNTAYSALLTTYNAALAIYNQCIKGGKITTDITCTEVGGKTYKYNSVQ